MRSAVKHMDIGHATSLPRHRIAAVVLTHNSSVDLAACLAGLLAQGGVDLRLIVVDNASRQEERSRMEEVFLERIPGGVIVDVTDGWHQSLEQVQSVFIRNDRNAGYSAGNNIGARLAHHLHCAATLVINPDVQITSPDYLMKLADKLFAEADHVVAASGMRNLSGSDENPMYELSLAEELLLPIRMAGSLIGIDRSRGAVLKRQGGSIEKVSGCCLMIRTDFLHEQGYFDEGVFLYCEEAILAKQVSMSGRRVIYCPELQAIHAHRKSAKGDPVRRQIMWSRSRRYYHARYAGYGLVARTVLVASHWLVISLTWLRGKAGKAAS